MSSSRTLIFETKQSHLFYQKFYPELCENASSLTEIADTFSPLPEINRLETFRSILPASEHEQIETYLNTLEILRESLILTPQQVEHCFLELPRTPKNQVLKALLLVYLQSPLAEDRTAQIWKLIGALKTKTYSPEFNENVWIVRETPNSFLLNEFAQALNFVNGVSSVQIVEPWELSETSPLDSIQPLKQGSEIEALNALANHVALSLKTKPSALFIPFGGSAEARFFLKRALDRLEVEYHDLFEKERETPLASPLEFISSVRKDPSQPLLKRLKLSQFLLKKWEDGDWKEGDGSSLEKWKEQLTQEGLWDCVSQSALSLAEVKSEPSYLVQILPFAPLPFTKSHPVLAYANTEAFQPSLEETFLTFSEIETLFRAGFSLPRFREHRERITKTLHSFSHRANDTATLFTALDPLSLVGCQLEAIKLEARPEDKIPEIAPAAFTAVAPRMLSATHLETYAQCPAKYFFANRLRLRRQLSRENQYALLFGQTVHLALEWYLSKEKQAEGEPREALRTLFQMALQEISGNSDGLGAIKTILTSHFEKVLPRFLRLENELQTLFGGLRPWKFEASFVINVEGVALTGKIDRIDKTPDGRALVLDYKTGNVDFCPDHIAAGHHFQALLYLLGVESLLPAGCAGILFYDLKKGEVRRGILHEHAVSPEVKKHITRGHTLKADKFQAVQEAGVAHLREYAKKISQGEFTPAPDPQVCRYCDYVALCRKGHAHV